MSKEAQDLRERLRVSASEKRAKMAADQLQPGADLAGVLARLDGTLAALAARLNSAAPSGDAGPAEFVVTERDADGRIKSFRERDMEFVVTERDLGGKIAAFKVGKVA